MGDTLKAGERLHIGHELRSANGLYRLIMQADGNLVQYDSGGTALWDTGTWSLPAWFRPTYAILQDDGNFVLYNAAKYPAWESATQGHPGSQLVLQDDRNVVISNADNAPVWGHGLSVQEPELAAASLFGNVVVRRKNEQVGWGKRIDTTAVLYRDGRLGVDSYQKNDNWTGGLRGRILVVCLDGGGRAHWVSDVINCPTRCSIPDFTCASYGRSFHFQGFPEPVGRLTQHLDIYQADNPNYVDLRAKIIEFIRGLKDIAQEIKDALPRLI
jgi:hypothetical protein